MLILFELGIKICRITALQDHKGASLPAIDRQETSAATKEKPTVFYLEGNVNIAKKLVCRTIPWLRQAAVYGNPTNPQSHLAFRLSARAAYFYTQKKYLSNQILQKIYYLNVISTNIT